MACDRYDDLIQQHFDQALTKDESQELHRHLTECSRCRVDFALYRKVFATMDELSDVPAPEGLARDILAAVDREPPVQRVAPAFWGLRAHVWYGIAAAAAVVLVAVGLFGGGPGPLAPLPQPALVAALDHGTATGPTETVRAVAPEDQLIVQADGATVQVLRSGVSRWQDVDGETSLAFGDTIKTSGGKAVLQYRDSGRLKILPCSEVQVLARGVRVRTGGVWVRIFKKGTAFYAETPNAVASVRGTIFTVDALPDGSSSVGVFEGKVLVQAGSADKPVGTGTMVLVGKGVTVANGTVSDPAQLQMAFYLKHNQLPPDELVTGGTTTTEVGGTGTPTGTGEPVPGWTDLGGQKRQETGPGFDELNK